LVSLVWWKMVLWFRRKGHLMIREVGDTTIMVNAASVGGFKGLGAIAIEI